MNTLTYISFSEMGGGMEGMGMRENGIVVKKGRRSWGENGAGVMRILRM